MYLTDLIFHFSSSSRQIFFHENLMGLIFCLFVCLFFHQRWRDKTDVLRYLPTKDLCLQSVIYAKLMTDRKTNGLADFNAKFQYDPIAVNSREL